MIPKTVVAVLALALLTLTSAPVAEDAEARPVCVRDCGGPTVPCVIGSDSDCKIKIVCVMAPCHPERFPPSP